MSTAQKANVLAVFECERFTQGVNDFGFPVVTRTFVERLRSRWAIKSNSYFIGSTPAFDGTSRELPAGTVRGSGENQPFIWSTYATKRHALTALARIGGWLV